MKYIVKNDLDWREIVTGKYTVLNSITATTLGAQVQGTYMDPANDNELLPAIMPNLRSPNGIRGGRWRVSDSVVPRSFPQYGYERSSSYRQRDVEAIHRAVYPAAGIALEDGVFRNAVTDNPGCAVCHDVMDPMGGALQNWAPNNRYRPNGQGAAADILPNYYKSTDFMDAPKGGEYYQMGDKWFRDRKAPGYGNTICRTPTTIRSQQSGWANSSRPIPASPGVRGSGYKVLFQREVLQPVRIRPHPMVLPAWLPTTHSRRSSTSLLHASRLAVTRSRPC